jgi:hypothetical protein
MQRQFSVEINQLQEGPEFSFGDWPNKIVPHVAAGLYSIWHGSEFIYVGMSGRGLTEDHLKSLADAGARKRHFIRVWIAMPQEEEVVISSAYIFVITM